MNVSKWLEKNDSENQDDCVDVNPKKSKSCAERKTYPPLIKVLEWVLPNYENVRLADGEPIPGWVDVNDAVKITGVTSRSLNTMRNKPTAEKLFLNHFGILFRDASGRIAFRAQGSQAVLYWLETLRHRERFWKKMRQQFSRQAKIE